MTDRRDTIADCVAPNEEEVVVNQGPTGREEDSPPSVGQVGP